MLSLAKEMKRRTLRPMLAVSRMSTKAAYFSKRMSRDEEEHIHELYNISSNSSERKFFLDNENAIRELIYVLRKHDEGSTKALLYAIESIHNIAEDEALLRLLTNIGVCSPLIRLLHKGPEEVKGEVSLCLHQLQSQGNKKRQLLTSTIDSFLAHDSVMQASISPLLHILHTDYPADADPLRYSPHQQEEALDALLRYTVRNLQLTNSLVKNNAMHKLIPLLFSGEKKLVSKALRLMSLMTSAEMQPLQFQTPTQKNSLIYSLLYVLNAYHTDQGSEAEGDGVARCDSLPPLPPPATHQSVQIQNTCCVILKHLMVSASAEAEGAAGAAGAVGGTEREGGEVALATTIVEAGGLEAALKLYDHNLAASGQDFHHQLIHPHLHSHPHPHPHHNPQHYQLPHPSQQKVLELLHSFSSSHAAIHWLFEEQRYDIIFGFLRNGLQSSRALITAEMWALLRHLPCSSGGGCESSWVQMEDVARGTATGADDVIADDVGSVGTAEWHVRSKMAAWRDLYPNSHHHQQEHQEQEAEDRVAGVQASRAEHLAHLLLSSEHWLDLLLDDLTTSTSTSTSTSTTATARVQDSSLDSSSSLGLGPEERSECASVSEQATMSMICQLLDYNDRFLSTILLDTHRHHALQTIVQLAAPPTSHQDQWEQQEREQYKQQCHSPQQYQYEYQQQQQQHPPQHHPPHHQYQQQHQQQHQTHTHSPSGREREENDMDGPDHHVPHIDFHGPGEGHDGHEGHAGRTHRHGHIRNPGNENTAAALAASTATATTAPSSPPPSRISALYALYRLAHYAHHERAPSASFTRLWQEDAVSVLLQAFLNADGSLELIGRQIAALGLMELCQDDVIRAHLLDEQEASLGGLNILEMIEWFLREEVYNER